MTEFEKKIYDVICASNGVKATQIAKLLEVDRHQVNSALYGSLKFLCTQDSEYKWHSIENKSIVLPSMGADTAPDPVLQKLCKYYLNCLSLEINNGVSEFLTSRYELPYAEIPSLYLNPLENNDAIKLLNRVSVQKNMVAYIGYPVLINTFYSSKTKAKYRKIIPVLLFAIEFDSGRIQTSSIPSVNMEIIKKYAAGEIDNQVHELIKLENELGFNSPNADFEIDELVARLQQIRQWDWKEKLDPEDICITCHVSEIQDDGIYNRAVVIAKERSPYTQGLESELDALSKMPAKQYQGTALFDWVNNTNISETNSALLTDQHLLEVLPLNTEQAQAIETTFTSNLTIITGPPGTGKSQVVTDFLVNAAWRENNALFTSKNNKAVDVVDVRVNALCNRPIMLRIGSNQYAFKLAELIESILSSKADLSDKADYEHYERVYKEKIASYDSLKSKKDAFISIRNRLDNLEQRFCLIRDRWGMLYNRIACTDVDELEKSYNEYVDAYKNAQKELQPFFTRLFWFILCAERQQYLKLSVDRLNCCIMQFELKPMLETSSPAVHRAKTHEIADCLGSIQLILHYKSLMDDFAAMEPLEEIDRKLAKLKKSHAEIAQKLWNKWLITRSLNISMAQRNEMTQYVTAMKLLGDVDLSDQPIIRQQFKKLQKEMTRHLPCWAITSLSAKGRIPFQPGIFDHVIIDEASQCDIASFLPLLFRAKKAVIIGDPKQLSHISTVSKSQDVSLLQKYEVGYEWSYSQNSLYDLAYSKAYPQNIIQLRDHHRSCAEIIEFSNREFYDGKLRIATDYSRLKTPKNQTTGVRWINAIGRTIRPSNGSAYNNEEIRLIISELKHLVLENDYNGTVGVVAPFRAQADKIREEIELLPLLRNRLYGKNDFLVDTVHKFQGDQRDFMIFSTVISNGTHPGAIAFLNNTGNLFNVAITRARSVLVVVGDMEFCAKCNVPYMEHFVKYVRALSTQVGSNVEPSNQQYGREYPRLLNDEQVSDWEKMFYTTLFDAGIASAPQYPVDKYKLDLAVFSRGRKLDIEVDGEMYHRDWNGELCYRDQLRNQRLFEMGWDVKRFWVYQLRDELPWCIEQVVKWCNGSD